MMRVTRGIGLPTSRTEWRLMGRTIKLVLSNWKYALFALLSSLVALSVFSLTQNFWPIVQALQLRYLTLQDKLFLVLDQYPFIGTYFTTVQSILLCSVAILTGVNLTLALYHFREHGLDLQTGSVGTVGTVLGVLGAGCAACGSAILVGLLSLVGISTSLLFLPLDGLEFLGLAIVALTLSIYWLADGMRGGEINGCPVDL